MKKIWSEIWGWGEVLEETDNFYIVRWDADPWVLEQVPKEI